MTNSENQTGSSDDVLILSAPVAKAAEEEAIAPQTPAAPQKNRRGGGFLLPVLGGAFAAAAGFGLAQYVPNGWPLAGVSSLEAKLTAQTATLERLQADLAAAQALAQNPPAPDLAPVMETLTVLNSRLAALETGPAERAADTEALAQALAKLQSDVTALAAASPIAAGQTTPPTAVAALTAEAEARLQAAEAEAARIKADAEAVAKAASTRAAFGRLQAAVDSGAAFADILPELGLEVPETLAAHADTGLPGLASLQAAFPEAARAALEAALRADMGESWTERAASFLRSQTGARSLTPREGDDPDAVLSRAEAALGAGDLPTAFSELDVLPEVAQAAMADWRSKAEARQAALMALQSVAEKIGG